MDSTVRITKNVFQQEKTKINPEETNRVKTKQNTK